MLDKSIAQKLDVIYMWYDLFFKVSLTVMWRVVYGDVKVETRNQLGDYCSSPGKI